VGQWWRSGLPAVTEIHNALLDSTTYEWTEVRHTVEERGEWLRHKREDGWPVLVAVDGEQVVGWATYGPFRDNAHYPGNWPTVEHTLHVAASHQGRGVGRALLEVLADQARSEGRWVMVAGADGTNTDSIAFHERLGFREVARMPGVGEKWGRRLDLVFLQHELSEPFS
jgi:phosphinothricin acetyltransferase